MLREIFFTLFKMNCIASIVAILLLIFKAVLQKIGCPRRISFFLWAVIAFRLLCPVAPATELSPFNLLKALVPATNQNMTVDRHSVHTTSSTNDATYVQVQPMQHEPVAKASVTQRSAKDTLGDWFTGIWLLGMGIMLFLGIASYLKLKRHLRFAIKLKDHIYTADNIPTSFVFGIIHPKIYIPEGISAQTMDNIILHEETHIRRYDHLAKIAAYILLSVHWFNPLHWVLFRLFSEDMEIACDESVLCKIGLANKKAYLDSLLQSALNHKRTVFLYHVCFSTNPTKRRIAAMIQFKPQSKLLRLLAVLFCVLLAVAFGTNASNRANEITPADQVTQGIGIADPVFQAQATAVPKPSAPQATIAAGTKTVGNAPTKEAVTETATASADDRVKIKSSNSEEVPDISFEQLIFEDINLLSIHEELSRQGITQSQSSGPVDLSKNFVVADYSYEKSLAYENSDIHCDENGNISLYFDLNSASTVEVSFYDSETKEQVGQIGILANDKNVYSFLGFDKDKTYNVKIQGQTNDEWQIEGEYIIY